MHFGQSQKKTQMNKIRILQIYFFLFPAKLLLTPMRHMVVPPPMSAHAVELPSPASCVSFAPPPNCSDMAVLLSNGSVAVFKSLAENGVKGEYKPPGNPPKLVVTYR